MKIELLAYEIIQFEEIAYFDENCYKMYRMEQLE